jgi:hypothetical protein
MAYDEDDKLVMRAMRAYLLAEPHPRRAAASLWRPSYRSSAVLQHEGKPYVVLADRTGAPKAVYRLTNQDRLRRLRRPPAPLLKQYSIAMY